ncbi:MAG TPA: heme ABC exporter ATP-binding protein CcmA [Stenotrophobium sp.]|nr:heme ABC exporter ATP-binding protein CcmA [Stenotrophobium sp.]
MSILAVEDLTVHRGYRCLVRNLSLTVGEGEAIHLSGSNGVGKTSLLETLAGLREPAAGTVAPLPEARFLHWIGHKNALNLSLTPQENLEFWCGLNGQPGTAVVEVLARMGVERVRHRPCRTLSAGQKRRSALARLLIVHRPLWLLDEPLDGLDAQGLQCFAGVLQGHLSAGGGAVITSHQPLPAGIGGIRPLHLS